MLTNLTSCTDVSYKARVNKADKLALLSRMTKNVIKTNNFLLTVYQRIQDPNANFVFYIEGDGLIYHYDDISDNPTPLTPTVLELAAIDHRPNVVYIARPCQYTSLTLQPNCKNEYWTNKRFALEVVDSINEAIDKISQNHTCEIIGYSGGGGIAVLIAAMNPKVQNIITIAANLDHVAFNNFHHTLHMTGSLNPIDYSQKIRNIPQLHLSGTDDKIVPSFIADKFVRLANSTCVKTMRLKSVTHSNGWKNFWPNIIKQKLSCS